MPKLLVQAAAVLVIMSTQAVVTYRKAVVSLVRAVIASTQTLVTYMEALVTST